MSVGQIVWVVEWGKAKVIVDMAGCGDAVFLYELVRAPVLQGADKVDICVSAQIVISKAVEEEWGYSMRSLGGIRTEIVNVEH